MVSIHFLENETEKEAEDVLDRVLQRNRINSIYKEIYYEKLAHVVMKANSHELLSASWKPRKARSIIQSNSQSVSIRGDSDINLSLRAGKDEMSYPSSCSEAEKGKDSSYLPFLFYTGPH